MTTGLLYSFRPLLNSIRGNLIAGTYGLRPFEVYVVNEFKGSKQWTTRASTFQTITKLCEDGYGNLKVKFLSKEDLILGIPEDSEIEVSFTPSEDGTDGIMLETIIPSEGSVYYLLNGPGFNNTKYVKTGILTERILTYRLYLKRSN
jgi:hypothetical protein